MKKVNILLLSVILSAVMFSCEKANSDLVSSNTTSAPGGSGGTSGGSGSGGSGGGSGTGGGGVVTSPGFSAGFTIGVPDLFNVFENNTVKLVSDGGGITSYYWNLGDGRKSFEKSPVISYPAHGYYTISLTVKDANGRSETLTKDLGILCNFGGGTSGNGSH
jgi:hypothetical protein